MEYSKTCYIFVPNKIKIEMKKVFLMLSMSLGVSLYSQETIGSYTMEYSSAEFDVQATQPKDGEYKLYIDMYSLDPSVKMAGIVVKSSELSSFVGLLQDAKNKYIEWEKLAMDNNVTDLDKDIPTTTKPRVTGFFRYGDWKFDYSVTLRPRFLKTAEKTLVLIHTGKLVASDNQYMDVNDVVMVFSNIGEIDALISLLDPAKVTEFYSKKTNTEDMFN